MRLGTGVKRIANFAVYNCRPLKAVVFPDSVEVVGKDAFCNCARLEELRLGEGLKSIEEHAFKGCASLTSVVIPDSLIPVAVDAYRQGAFDNTNEVVAEIFRKLSVE